MMNYWDNLDVVFCDNHVLIAIKPSGLATQPDFEEWVKGWVKQEYHKEGNVFLQCVHRLDRPVSGLLLFARTSKALSRLNEQVRSQEVQRTYIAEVEGTLSLKSGQLDHQLLHGDHRAIVSPEGKHARLTYEVLGQGAHSTFVQIELETGRYHQIRAQFGAIGHPVVGDQKYGAHTKSDAIHLHCAKLAFVHPVTKELLSFTSAAPFTCNYTQTK